VSTKQTVLGVRQPRQNVLQRISYSLAPKGEKKRKNGEWGSNKLDIQLLNLNCKAQSLEKTPEKSYPHEIL